MMYRFNRGFVSVGAESISVISAVKFISDIFGDFDIYVNMVVRRDMITQIFNHCSDSHVHHNLDRYSHPNQVIKMKRIRVKEQLLLYAFRCNSIGICHDAKCIGPGWNCG